MLFNTISTAFQNPGGGETVILKTKEYLEKIGIQVDLYNPWSTLIKGYDVVHYFSLGDFPFWKCVKAHRDVRLVVTPISWPDAGIRALLKRRIKKLIRATLRLNIGQFEFENSLHLPDLFFPGSKAEGELLIKVYGIDKDRVHVVPHGVDPLFLGSTPDLFVRRYGLKNFVLCVGRFEYPRKNQLAVVRALRNSEISVVFIGSPQPGHEWYYERCLKEAGKNMYFLGRVDLSVLVSAYAAARVLILPGLVETPGLVALEAGLAGTDIIVTRHGCTMEYFGEYARYIDPRSEEEIRKVVWEVYNEKKAPGRNVELQNYIRSNYLWEKVAERTLEGYRRALKL